MILEDFISERKNVIQSSMETIIDSSHVDELVLLLTPQCKMGCKYCYEAPLWRDSEVITPKLSRIIDLIRQYSPRCITLLGGDTFTKITELTVLLELFPDIEFRMFNDARRSSLLMEFMTKYPNLNSDVSIDPGWYTRFTSEEAWVKSLEDVSSLVQKFGNRITINLVITKHGYDWSILRRFLGEDARIYVKPIALDSNDSFEPTEFQKEEIVYLMKKEFQRKFLGENYIPQIDRYIHQVKSELNFRCSCGRRRLTVDWDGRLSFCDALPLSHAWDASFIDPKNIVESLSSLPDKCKECEMVLECGGPCVILSPPNDFYCWFQIEFLKLAKQYVSLTKEKINVRSN